MYFLYLANLNNCKQSLWLLSSNDNVESKQVNHIISRSVEDTVTGITTTTTFYPDGSVKEIFKTNKKIDFGWRVFQQE